MVFSLRDCFWCFGSWCLDFVLATKNSLLSLPFAFRTDDWRFFPDGCHRFFDDRNSQIHQYPFRLFYGNWSCLFDSPFASGAAGSTISFFFATISLARLSLIFDSRHWHPTDPLYFGNDSQSSDAPSSPNPFLDK